jgi:hypothetical protein
MANQEIRDVVFNLQVRTEDGKVKIENLTKSFVKSETAMKKMKAELDLLNDSVKNNGVSTGLANTAILEFGRTVSDAPYGIQGMGNNISQLTTIIGQMSGDVKEGETVIGNLRDAFMGPLGVVVGVQIAIAAFEIFAKRMSETTDVLTKLDVAVGKSAVNLKLAKTALDNENTSLEEKQEIVNALNEQYPEWNLQLEESGNISDNNAAKIDAEIAALGRLAKAKAYQGLLEEAYAKKVEMSAAFAREQGTTLSRLKNVFAGFGSEVAGQTIRFKAFQDGLKDVNDDISFLEKGVQKEGLVDLLLGSDAKGKPKKETRKKVKEFVVDTYGIASEEAVKAAERQQKLMKKLGIDIPSMLLGGEEGKEAFKEGLASLYQEVENVPIDYSGVGTSFNEILETMAPAFAEIGNFFSAEAERAIAIEENKTNRINDQLKKRLANEQLSADERDKINQQIARNEAKLVEKENEINKKRFEQEKAFSIVQATINTYLAASDVLAREKMGAVGKAIAVAAVITSGLAQVASISRQKFVGKAMPTPNLTGQGVAGGSLGAPDFNIVGASQQSQIAEAIAGTRNEPLKAYVVSSDVTSAQELDRKILEGASI